VKRLMMIVMVCLFGAAGCSILLYKDIQHYSSTPAGETQDFRIMEIQRGLGLGRIARQLSKEGIIREPLKFRLVARIYGYDRRIKAGQYRFSAAMSPLEILDMMSEGRVFLYRLTVPEGLTLKQIAPLLDQAGTGNSSEFLRMTTDPAFAGKLEIAADTLEGYTFPDTYHFPGSVTTEAVIRAMIVRFKEVFIPEWQERAKELNMTVHQVVTLASIIEKETGVADERPLIASVFHNRLKRGMRLQTDPTVIYGIPDFDGNLTRKHLQTPTAYNTYTIKGLPPGPIAAPGADSLRAALYPAQSDYLYFVSKGNGTHSFSASLNDHNRAVREYQLK